MELSTQPPPPDAIAAMSAIDGVHIAPTILATQTGPVGHLGPEAAQAVLMLQATFAVLQTQFQFQRQRSGLLCKGTVHVQGR